MRIIQDTKLDFKDVLFVPKRSTLNSRKEVDLQRTYKFRNSQQYWTGIPIMAANMDGVGTFSMHNELSQHNMLTAITKQPTLNDWIEAKVGRKEYIVPSIGISQDELQQAKYIMTAYPGIKFICVDVANGYTAAFQRFIEQLRKELGNEVTLIAGNVVTPEITEELILNGIDIVKVGIGPGSVCTTRRQTGVGYPQLSAIIECADAAHGLGGHIIADGGCTCPGDVAKAFGAGADFVMLGGMLAGHDEGGGTIIEERIVTGRQHKANLGRDWNDTFEYKKSVQFYGMSSDTAMEKHSGGVAAHRSSEGKTVTVPYKGPVENTVLDILGGLRSTCTYVGARSLKELSKRTTFVRVTQQINNVFGSL
jgi:GMP reductase